MIIKWRYFLAVFVLFVVIGLVFALWAQPEKQRPPVSRLAEHANVRWTAIESAQRAPLKVESTLKSSLAKLKLTVPGYETAAVRRENIDFARFDIPGAGVTPAVGKPELPVIRRFVAVPEGAKITFKQTAGQPKILENIIVFPVQEPLPEGSPQPPQPQFVMDRNFYRLDQNYPGNLVTVSPPMKMRNVTVVMVEMAAMQYNPAKKTLTVYPGLDVELSFSKPFVPRAKVSMKRPQALQPPAKPELTPDEAPLPKALQIADKYSIWKQFIIDKPWISHVVFYLKWHYLIITPDVYYEEIQPLVQWKRAKGLHVVVKKLSQIAASPTVEQIQSAIKKAYDYHAVDYVLLVGDTDTMPGYNFSNSAGSTISDYYYTLVSGGDVLPDIALGRMSGRTEAEISHMVAKCVNYEITPPPGAWRTRALCISDSGYFETTSNSNHDLMESFGFTVDKIYASLGNATVANVTSAVNNGRLLISYRGHGSETSWHTTGFSNADVNALTNGVFLPVIISPTCLTGCYDYAASDCFAETWVKSYGTSCPRGSVTYWGSARVSYGGYNDELSMGAFDDIFTNGNHVIGDVVNNAKLQMLSVYGITDPKALLELYMFNLFGDPELHIQF
jgi:Peptidase family C25/Propeptide_C25